MTNMNINAGGVIGAILGAVGTLAFFALYQGEIPRRSGKLIGFAVLGCAFLGNWLWTTVFGSATDSTENADDDGFEDAETAPEDE